MFVPAAASAGRQSVGQLGQRGYKCVRTRTSAEPDMRVPHPRTGRRRLVRIPLDHNRARRYTPNPHRSALWDISGAVEKEGRKERTGPAGGEDDVGDLNEPLVAGVAHLEDRRGAVHVLERGASAHEHSPGLADHLRAGGDRDRGGDDIGPGIEEDDLAARVLSNSIQEARNAMQIVVNVRRDGAQNAECRIARTCAKMFLMAAVSSVWPSPFAPFDLTLTNWSTA